jgi:hypothetical protein
MARLSPHERTKSESKLADVRVGDGEGVGTHVGNPVAVGLAVGDGGREVGVAAGGDGMVVSSGLGSATGPGRDAP